jgi:Holliday junction resolvase RusA-like endonuclease
MYHRKGVGAFARPKTTRPDWDNLAKVFDDALMAALTEFQDACISYAG